MGSQSFGHDWATEKQQQPCLLHARHSANWCGSESHTTFGDNQLKINHQHLLDFSFSQF